MDVSNCGPAPSLYVHYRRSLVGYSRPFLASLLSMRFTRIHLTSRS